jgi:thioredoxin reductase
MIEKAIKSYTGMRCTEITPKGIKVIAKDGSEQFIDADTIVYAVGMKAHSDNAMRLCDTAPKQYFLIGDCVSPRKVKEAVHEGYHAAMDIL